MFIVSNRIDVPDDPADAEAFERVFIESMRTTLEGVPGLHRVTLQRPASPGVPYLSTMEFDTRDDFTAWLSSASFRAAHSDRQAPGMRAPSAIEQHELIESVTL